MYALQRGPSKLVASTRRGNFHFALSHLNQNLRTCNRCHFEGELFLVTFTSFVFHLGPTKSLNNLEKKDYEKDSVEENIMRFVHTYIHRS